GRMPQLVEGSAHDHALDFSERFIGAQTACIGRHSEPYLTTAAFYRRSERAIVDYLVPHRGNSAGTREHRWANQNAPSSRTRNLAPGVSNPLRRIQHEKEKHECWDEQLFSNAAAMQRHHERGEIVAATFRHGDKRGYIRWRVLNISIGKQQKLWLQRQRLLNSLL